MQSAPNLGSALPLPEEKSRPGPGSTEGLHQTMGGSTALKNSELSGTTSAQGSSVVRLRPRRRAPAH